MKGVCRPIRVRGIRGAITVERNTREEIIAATKELLLALVRENGIEIEDIASIFFTLTPDLNAEFPALAARELGWQYVPLLCAQEIDVPGAMGKVLRVLMHVNTEKSQRELKHLYLKGAATLRLDLSSGN
ncbi:chorismate mutase [Thermodesulfitimonas autotrophica]|uniref:chorismate mutase n=1 Tax=Thermodesulfitimonas autotrophica TaxID=1894989 RepID=A0A3N5AYB8_9THEO|nr:chorismate mutase [Thermodesulfitimonas autotrophica]RPF49923.1 chorismate mutase [Thermodesulfitimonas autotrophica]